MRKRKLIRLTYEDDGVYETMRVGMLVDIFDRINTPEWDRVKGIAAIWFSQRITPRITTKNAHVKWKKDEKT